MEMDIVALLNSRIGLSQSAIDKTFITVNAIFESAVNNRLIQFNPCRGITVPDGSEGTHRCLENWEIEITEKVAQTHRLGFGIMLMLWAGLRKGEACAFTDDCVNSDDLNITKSIEWNRNQGDPGTPKSDAGVRSVPIWPKLRPFLGKSGYAIVSSSGAAPVSLTAFNRAFDSFLSKCAEELNGCTKRWKPKDHVWKDFSFTPHDLRHTWFTMLYDAGVDVKIAASWGGHANPEVTQRIYTHIREERSKAEAKKAIAKTTAGNTTGNSRKTYRIKR